MIQPKKQINNIYGYIRVSSEQQVKHGSSLEQQEQSIRAFVKQKYDREVDKIFVDAGTSGMKPIMERQGSRELTDTMDANDVVVCTKLDRLARSFLEMVNLIPKFEEAGITLYFCDMFGDIPVALPKDKNKTGLNMKLDMIRMSNQMLVNNLAMFAEFEREQIMSRLYGGKIAYAERGYSIGGHTPFGYRKVQEGKHTKLEPIPNEQEVLKAIYKLAGRGRGAKAISKQIESSFPEYPQFPYHKVQRILNRKFQGLLDEEDRKYDTYH